MSGGAKKALALASCVLMFVPLWHLDQWLASGHRPRVTYMRMLQKRLTARPNADVAIMGQSTIGQWLVDGDHFAKTYRMSPKRVVGAQLGGCDYTCSFAEARGLLASGKHFEQLYFGANLYQMCEEAYSWRVFMPLVMIPWADLPDLLRLWSHGRQPLSYYGRALGMAVSDAYDDTLSVRARLVSTFGLPRTKAAGAAVQWAVPVNKPKGWSPSCDYSPEQVAMKSVVVEWLMRDLTRLADEVYYLALPDRSLSDPRYRPAFKAFLAHQRELAARVPGVRFLDLVTQGASQRADYIDGAHLSARGRTKQTALLKKQLSALGVKP